MPEGTLQHCRSPGSDSSSGSVSDDVPSKTKEKRKALVAKFKEKVDALNVESGIAFDALVALRTKACAAACAELEDANLAECRRLESEMKEAQAVKMRALEEYVSHETNVKKHHKEPRFTIPCPQTSVRLYITLINEFIIK